MTKHTSFNESSAPININGDLRRVPPPIQLANKIDQENRHHLISESYRHYSLCFCDTQSMCVGEVFKNEQRLAYCEALNLESAQQYCRQIVDKHLSKQTMNNSHSKPLLENLSEAMLAIQSQLDEYCHNLLQIHLNNHNRAITIDQLKSQANFHSTTAVFLTYAQWSRLLCDALTYLPPRPISGKDPYLSYVIHSEEAKFSAEGALSISLQPDIYKALSCIHSLKV